jgi:glycosyltransferase involved in cell wall biosynthesis
MRVNVASYTATHLLDLARELAKAEALGRFYIALPRFRVPGIPEAHLRTHPSVFAPQYVLRRLGLGAFEPVISGRLAAAFDRWLTRALEPCDVFHVGTSYGVRAARHARSAFNPLIVRDRGSSHIRTQDRLLAEEHALWGLPYDHIKDMPREDAEYAEADVIVVASRFARQSFLDEGVDADKVVIVPYGASLEEYFPTGKRDDVFRVLCVASLTVRKGIGYLLEATSQLALPNSEVVLRGTIMRDIRPVLARYEGSFRLTPPPARSFGPGSVASERAGMSDLYSQASVLVLPSIEDGFGLVIGQAMACGVPVIATTNTGGPDLITDGKDGFIVPIRNSAAIRERLEYLYTHPDERAAMGAAAIEKVKSLGGWAQYGRLMLQLYRERLARRRAA